MYICAEQKSTAFFEGREIKISERAANAHYRMCNMPITNIEVDVYLNVTLQEDVAKLPRFTDEFLSWLIEVNVMDELESLNLEWIWELPNERKLRGDFYE